MIRICEIKHKNFINITVMTNEEDECLLEGETRVHWSNIAMTFSVPPTKLRNIIAFWFLGLCNNYAYVVMLSAAGDILAGGHKNHDKDAKCTPESAGAILLADILPALCIKLFGPFININTHVAVGIVVLLSVISFVMTSFTATMWVTFTGVIAASLGSGLGEITFLKYSTKYNKSSVSAWSSGTGAAGVLGSFAYAAITLLLSPETTLRVMLVVPFVLAISFWVILEHPRIVTTESQEQISEEVDIGCCTPQASRGPTLSLSQKIRLVKPLLKYMIPLGLVYFAEYFINQGLTELITFDIYSVAIQYRWYQVCYQVGVFISRSSVNFVHIHHLWALPVLQIINAVFFTFEAIYRFVPSFWIVVVIIVYEGLLGGASYVNTFYKITNEVSPQYREFSMGVTSLADSLGITLSAFAAIWAHNLICAYRNA